MNSIRLARLLVLARLAIVSLLLCIVPGCTHCTGEEPDNLSLPNIVVILVDDLGYADVSFQGGQVETPNIDALAADGVRFTRGYANASVCHPSRVGFLTGRYQQELGIQKNLSRTEGLTLGLPTDEKTLADRLKARGYETAAIGKWHLGTSKQYQPIHRGFDFFFGFLEGGRSYWPNKPKEPLLYENSTPVPERKFEYLTDEFARVAEGLIGQSRKSPFFLYLATSAVHSPLEAPEHLLAQVDDVKRPKRKKMVAMTRSLDQLVARVVAQLKAKKLYENTIIVFFSDNGGDLEMSSRNTPLREGKGTAFEGGIRVPMVLSWPKKIKPAVYDVPVMAMDLTATLLDAVGAQSPATADGVDVLPHLEKQTRPDRVLHFLQGERWAVIDNDWKLVFGRQKFDTALFDLSTDPGESKDLSEEYPEKAAALLRQHELWQAKLPPLRW